MTSDQAKKIYYDKMHLEYVRQNLDWTQPVIQSQAEAAAWQSVIDAITQEVDTAYALRYLEQQK